MTPPIGGSHGAVRSPRGALWFDVRDYGAKADNGTTDNSGPFQAAHDAAAAAVAASGATAQAVVFIPSAPQMYVVKKPVFIDGSQVVVDGDDRGGVVGTSDRFSPFVLGLNRAALAPADATYRPDAFGVLDSSVVTGAGQRWGLRTKNTSVPYFQGQPLSNGPREPKNASALDNWGTTGLLTLECLIRPHGVAAFTNNTTLLGLGALFFSKASPFFMAVANNGLTNQLILFFQTSEVSRYEPFPLRNATFFTGTTPPYRVAVCVDLVNAAVYAFVNGVQVATTVGGSPPFVGGVKFKTNDYYPFIIGSDGPTWDRGSPPGSDLELYGLRVSNTLRYQNNGVGQVQKRADQPSTPLNDAWAYFGNDANTVAYLPLQDNPATAGFLVSVQNGGATLGGTSYGYFINTTTPFGAASTGVTVRNLRINGNWYQPGITPAAVLGLTIKNCNAQSFFQGIGSLNTGAVYTTTVEDFDCFALDCAIFLNSHIAHVKNLSPATNGRAGFRMIGSGGTLENVLIQHESGYDQCAIQYLAGYTGGWEINRMVVDFEAGGTFSEAGFSFEYATDIGPVEVVRIKDSGFGTVGPVPCLALYQTVPLGPTGVDYGTDGHTKGGLVEITNFNGIGYSSIVRVDGPGWYGRVDALGVSGQRVEATGQLGPGCNVVFAESRFVAPPLALKWVQGAHVLNVPSPADGQFATWRCVQTGTYGTANPPAWAGDNPLRSTPAAMAAYVTEVGYITANLT